MVAHIKLDKLGDAAVRFKAYPYGGEEPVEWMIENVPYHFNSISLDYILLRGLMYHAYWGKIVINKKDLPLSAKIGSGGAQTNVYLSFAEPINASLVNSTSITGTGAAYTVSPVYANTENSVKMVSGAVVSFTYGGVSNINANVNVNIPSAGLDSVDILFEIAGLELLSISGVDLEPVSGTSVEIAVDLQGYATDGNAGAEIIAAVYDPDGVLLGVGTYNKTAYSEKGAVITVDGLDLDNFGYVKVFGWNSFGSLSPACLQPAVWPAD
jgi:hypothetical protein